MRRIALILILLSTVILDMASAAPVRCEDLFLAKTATIRQPIRSIQENWAAMVSRVKPTYQTSSFDLRILSTALSKNNFSPAALRERGIQEVESLLSSYRDMGFSFRSFIQVLVEAYPGAMSQLGLNENGKIIWKDTAGNTPWVGNATEFIGIPDWFGGRDLFVGKTDKMGFGGIPRFFALPAVTSTYHSMQNRFIISHELAHETENPNSHRDLMWREARADFLAFLTTGQTDVIFPEGIELELVREDGSTYNQRIIIVRSMSHPTVTSARELRPSLRAYHYNSQILSSALYKVAQTMGRDRAIEFVKWMDRFGGADAIPFLRAKPTEPDPDFKPKANTEYVDRSDMSAVRSAIGDHLNRVGQFFRRWATETDLAPNERSMLLAILTERGI